MSETLDLTCQFIRCRSITPDDAGCMEIIQQRLEPRGFSIEQLDFGKTRNLFVRHGKERPLLVFLGHTDVVPSGPESDWSHPPFEPTIVDGMLYGRGAADMKSGVAAMVTALERFASNHPNHPGSVAMLMTSDEEGAATDGVVKVIEVFENRGEKIDWCLIGEPSSFDRLGDVIRVGRRGSLCGALSVLGTQGHVAYPEKADNPIHRLAPALEALTQEVWDQGNAFFPPTSFQISNIKAGTGAENVIPGRLELSFNFRFSTELTETLIRERVEAILDRYGLRYELSWRLSGAPFLTAGTTLIKATQDAIHQETGQWARPDTGGGTSDGRFIAPTGAEIVELGPLNGTIHKVDEQVPIGDLEPLSRIYEGIMEHLLGSNPSSSL
ncbi:MAG: succinyl-diaminopimelate desuccinylase [Gammaproteobacteria bacterium]|nr:succinyl-diaminopimelate desuccinylase [Gammaproteobacteria bacterium]NBT44038.1 succinyl-diaminopimelate desuccinylase [Gammaproteobacteria bacterium]NDE56146.1 succinyl-diaminopimelate desuccinylase [Gammaproteobacteria bacterium]